MNFGQGIEAKTKFLFNEVTTLTGVKPYVLRFWESEFPQISPQLDSNDKYYSEDDVKVISLIKKLLFEDKLSIPEVKNIIDNELDTYILPESNELEGIEPACLNEEVQEKIEFSFDTHKGELAHIGSIVTSKEKLKELYAFIEAIEHRHCWI